MKTVMFIQAFFGAINVLAGAVMKVAIGGAALLIALSFYR